MLYTNVETNTGGQQQDEAVWSESVVLGLRPGCQREKSSQQQTSGQA